MKNIQYIPEGVCSRLMNIDLTDDDRIGNVSFVGGCYGNLQGIASLVRGMKCEEVIERLQGIRCGSKCTSCPDQLSKALKQMKLME